MSDQGMMIRVLTPSPELTFLDLLPEAIAPSFLNELKADGAGSFRLPVESLRLRDTPEIVNSRNVVQHEIDGEIQGAWLLRNCHKILVGKGESAELFYEFSGPGLRDWLHDAVVYPSGVQPLSKKKAGTRYFNFACAAGSWYRPTAWVPVTATVLVGDVTSANPWIYAPIGWPDVPQAKWIWDRDSRTVAPVGDVYFRKTFTTMADLSFALFATADDNFQAYLDGIPILSANSVNGWTQLYRGDLDLPAGDHVLAIKATNSGGPAGVMASLFSYQDAKLAQPSQLITFTGDTGWLCSAYPTTPPGWTPGEILRVLMEEAKARGVDTLMNMPLGFTDALDSDGEPWEGIYDWAFDVGAEYLNVIESMEGMAVEVAVHPATFALMAYNAQGTDKSEQVGIRQPIVFRRGHNVLSASEDSEAVLKNVYLMGYGNDLLAEVVDPHGTIPKYGRIEGFTTSGSDTGIDKARLVATKLLELSSAPQESASIVITDVEDNTPFKDFSVGDWVLGPGSTGSKRRRVVSISASADGNTGQPMYEVELDTLAQDRIDKINKFLLNMPQFQLLGETVSPNSTPGGSGGGGYTGGGYTGGNVGSGYGGSSGVGGGGTTVYVQSNEPTGVPVGTLWYDTDATYS